MDLKLVERGLIGPYWEIHGNVAIVTLFESIGR